MSTITWAWSSWDTAGIRPMKCLIGQATTMTSIGESPLSSLGTAVWAMPIWAYYSFLGSLKLGSDTIFIVPHWMVRAALFGDHQPA